MQAVRVVRRDAGAHRWEYALAGLMVATTIVARSIRLDDDTVVARSLVVTVLGWSATIGASVALVGRSRWPLACCAMVTTSLFVLGATGNSDTVGYVALLIGLYSAAAHLPVRRSIAALAMVLALVGVSLVFLGTEPSAGLIGAGAAFALGYLTRQRRARQEDQATAARERAVAGIELAHLDAAADRQRMAQELHDVVAHSLSVIAVQAGIGAHLVERAPAEAVRALEAIAVTGRAAEGELDHLIDVLRDGSASTAGPGNALTDVAALCATITEAGVPVDLVTEGDLGAVPFGVSLAAYRVVQEALTNVVRHAGPTRAAVTVRASSGRVELRIDDDGVGVSSGPAARRPDGGHGLVGMTERARMYGGELTAGPRPERGFSVRATMSSSADALAVEAPDDVVPGPVDDAGPNRFDRVPRLAFDVALALVVAAIGVVELLAAEPASDGGAFTANDGRAWILKIGCCLMLAGRRRYPTTSFLAATVLAVTLTIGDYETGIVAIVFVIGAYAVGTDATTPRFVAALVAVAAAMGVVAWSEPPDLTAAGAAWTAAIAAASALTGRAVRRDREHRDARTVAHELAGAADARRARLVVTTERLRVAEELDEVITRSIRTITEQAACGSEIVARDPAGAAALLEAISLTSRDALGELRRLLTRMRPDSGPAHHPSAPSASRAMTTGGGR